MSTIKIDDVGLCIEVTRDDSGDVRLIILRDLLPVASTSVKVNGDTITHALAGGRIAGSLAIFGGYLFVLDANGDQIPFLPASPIPKPAAAPDSNSNGKVA